MVTMRKVKFVLIDDGCVIGGEVDCVNVEGTHSDYFAHPIPDKFQVHLLK